MQQDRVARGVIALGIMALVWGGTWPVAKDALTRLDPYWLSCFRYIFAPILFVIALVRIEGRAALSHDGRMLPAAILGAVGFAGYNLFAFVGLRHTTPEHVALVSALQAPLAVLGQWWFRGVRPATFTLACVVIAFVGVAVVATKGDPASALVGGSLIGDALVLAGAIAWVAYGFGMARFRDWSPLRFTTITSIWGGVAIFACAVIASLLGLAAPPGLDTIADMGWQLAYLTVVTGFIGVLCWNAGVSALGPLNAGLAINLVPVVTFTIRVFQGYRFAAIEVVGALLVLGALVANNLYLRKAARSAG
jgi:drug/metabolite transporter (DMT)-like permease